MTVAQPKRIALITNRFYPQLGGAELNTYLQALELGKHFMVDVITPVRENDKRTEQLGSVQITRARNWYNLRNDFPYLESNTLCPSVFTRIIRGRYDLVHCFPAVNRNNVLALWAARARGIPVFLTNFDAFDYARVINEGSLADIEKLSLTKRQEDYLSRFAAVFTISERETTLLMAVNENTFLSVVPIQPQEYQEERDVKKFRRDYGIPEDKMIILCLSRVAYVKGQDILLKVVPKLKDRLEDFVVVFVGRTDYEPSYHDEMRQFVDRKGLAEYIKFTGGIRREDALAALKACAMHVVPVRFMNSGAVVVESWASRRPVLQSNRVDPNYVEENRNGLTFDIDDPEDLVGKIVYLAERDELRKQMGLAGRELVDRKFLYEHLIDQYVKAYERFGGLPV